MDTILLMTGLIEGGLIVQENEPGIPAPLKGDDAENRARSGRFGLDARGCARDAYFGGLFSGGGAGGGGVELMEPFGLELSEGGMVVVVPGEVDWSVEDGGLLEVSAGGEAAEPAGDVDSCLEQAEMSASAPTHNNRTLRFI